jgi:nitrate/nitrite transporter NarK
MSDAGPATPFHRLLDRKDCLPRGAGTATALAAAAGLAAINSVGNLGGFIAQNVVPWIRDATGSTIAPMLFLAACLAAGGLMTFFVQAAIRRRHPEAAVAA